MNLREVGKRLLMGLPVSHRICEVAIPHSVKTLRDNDNSRDEINMGEGTKECERRPSSDLCA
jgi:hypothetical protein